MTAGEGEPHAAAVKAILCYGDSNTWGSDPAYDETRFAWPVRWPGVLQRELGDGYRVIEEALGGRTTVFDDALQPHRSGLALLAPCLESHAPLDLVVIMLGTNDISYPWMTAAAAADGAGMLAHAALCSEAGPAKAAPRVLLLCPPPVGPLTTDAELYPGAVEKSRELPLEFTRVAALVGCQLLDAGEIVTTSPLDGWHLAAGEHARLGAAVAERVRGIIG